ncbi:Ig-like domain-containing domain [Pontibacter sp. 13R65]|uniref:Ig-like domain-containing domain n=1 Tax=Pontibacter sp. 13R65 TaxID=3127458 RepID=UPI00301E13B2
MKLFNLLLVASAASILTACATVGNPEGGPKDEVAPTLTYSNPKDGELNVRTNTITLEFDEEVQPNKLTTELLITPNTENKYTVKTKKNQMEISFEEPFEPNSTYTLNFRNGVQDITEKNVAKGLKLTFSTGTFIDSSKVSGTVVELLSQITEKEIIVALYPLTDSLNIRKNRPYYQTQTNANGEFTFENIKEGAYRIFAVLDKNNNNIYDNENERIAYLPEPLNITPTTDSVRLQTIRIDTKKPQTPSRENYLDRFVLNYNEGISTFTARPEASQNDTLLYKIGPQGKVIDIFEGTGFTGGRAIFAATDSAGNQRIDTVAVKFEGKRSQRIKGAQLKAGSVGGGSDKAFRTGQQITLELETQVKLTGTPVRLLADTVELQAIRAEQLTLDKTATELSFTMPPSDKRINQLTVTLDSTAIVPLKGGPLQFQPIPLPKADDRGTGSFKGSVKSNYTSYFIQILTKDFKFVREVKNVRNFDFKNMEPGSYIIRVLIDEDNDTKWFTGDPKFERLPEKVYIYPKPIEIRANWELEAIVLEF